MQDGFLTVFVVDRVTNAPIQDALVSIYGIPDEATGTTTQTIIYENLPTDISGQVTGLTLSAPDLIYSQQPSNVRPYSRYIVEVKKDGYETVVINGCQVFPVVEGRQPVQLEQRQRSLLLYKRQNEEILLIDDNTLYGNYPPKIPEADLKPLPPPTGFVVLDNPVVPEFIIVHDGLPTDTSAKNYWMLYKDYIKNVASSEIYSTWPTATIYSNIIAIISFTLNRVYTEWYRNQGYNFTITSTTNFDHKFIYGRNTFNSINVAVDEVFNTYIKRPPTARQPLLSQYCDGAKVQCPGQMTQWGSKALGDQGKTYEQILRSFYGNNLSLQKAQVVTGVPISYPGYALKLWSNGAPVRTIQGQLNAIANVYSAIPRLKADGIYGPATQASVRAFQKIFGLPQTGDVDFKTWYEISHIYTAVTKIAAL
jgi:hypothetical protein